ncbi:hypothetical protein CK203_099551 [Vitis vinifera]|uniref:Uncharacterized protein n=1 Tax=Vitis vinifera TaxID=29760 RepID=A0A438CJ58_VITVI|nr:hypothetical protein CK203_099551 [Vitis vinifera]
MEMSALSNRELQRLTGRLAALGRFIARFIDKLWPFFLALKGENTTGWTNDCKQALEKIKRYFTQPPILSCLEPGEQLYMYYVSKAMVGIETRYFKMEQTTLALKSAAQKLRPYFQAHQVTMLTNQPLRSILHRLDLSKRMLKPFHHIDSPEEKWWILHVDGASKASGSEIGLVLQSLTREQLEQAIQLGFPASNNEVEYEATLVGLDLALTLAATKLRIYNDSQLVIRQIQGEYEAKDKCMVRYLVQGDGHSWPITRRSCIEKFLLVATDYFRKWVEAEAYANIKDRDVFKFVWKTSSTGMPTPKIVVQGQRDENQELERHLDWANEEKGNAAIQMASYQQRAITHYNKMARPRTFKAGTLVLRRVFENTTEKGVRKLQENWEGPYVVAKAGDSGAYHLQTPNGVPLLRP